MTQHHEKSKEKLEFIRYKSVFIPQDICESIQAAKGVGLKIQSRRRPWVQIPSLALLIISQVPIKTERDTQPKSHASLF